MAFRKNSVVNRKKTEIIPIESDDPSPLTQNQLAFVRFVAEDGLSGSAAVRAAGYALKDPGAQAYDLMRQPKIIAAIAKVREDYQKASMVNKKRVIDGFLEAIEMAKLTSEPMTMVAGWREVGKMLGFYEPTKHKIDINVKGQVVLSKLEALSDDALLRIATGDGEGDVIDV